MSLLADHPNVQFNFYRPGIGTCGGGDALKIMTIYAIDHVQLAMPPGKG